MTWVPRAIIGVLFAIVLIVPSTLHADTVQLSLQNGRLSLVANNATPKQIFEAWSRAGGVLVVNAERMPAVPVTMTLENVPEEQALETILRSVSGYLARRRTESASADTTASVFDRIVILPTPASTQPPATAAAPQPAPRTVAGPPVFGQPSRPVTAQQQQQAPAAPPAGIPQGPGVTRLIGPDGQPVEDDQAGAPPPPAPAPYNGGDVPPDARAPVGTMRPGQQSPQTTPQPQPAPAPEPSSPTAPAGAPRPGMVVPAPQPQPQLR
jgi:hypothetical protein